MIQDIYAFYDKKAQELISPIFASNVSVFKRDLKNIYEKEKNNPNCNIPFVLFPDDFEIYKVGEFDTSGVVKNIKSYEKLFNIKDVIENQKEQI